MVAGLDFITRVATTSGGVLAGELLDTDYPTLAAAVTAIGATPGTLKVATPSFPNGASCTVPATLPIEFVGNGSLALTTGHTVTIQSDTSNWPIKKIFFNATAGQGEILFTSNRRGASICPLWWGGAGDDSTDSTAAIQAALHITEHNGSLSAARYFLPDGIYRVTGLTYRGNFTHAFKWEGVMSGAGLSGTIIKYTGSSGGTLFQMLGATDCHVKHVAFNGNALAKYGVLLDYDSSRSMSSFNCVLDNIQVGGCTGTDSACIVLGTSNFASAEHTLIHPVVVGHSTPGTTYYGILNAGSSNAKNYRIKTGSVNGFRYGISLGNSGYHKIDSVSFGGQTVADIVAKNAQLTVRDCGSEGSAMFVSDEGGNVTGNLLIEGCYWHGVTIDNDFVIDYDGQLTIISNEFYNNRAPLEKSFTVDTGTDLITCTAHGYGGGTRLNVRSTTTLPAPLTAATNYYVIESGFTANTFKVALTMGGAAIDITSAGSGTHFVFQPTEPAIKSGLALQSSAIRGSVLSLNNYYIRPTGTPLMDFIPIYDSSGAFVSSFTGSQDGVSDPNSFRGLQLFSFGDKSRKIDTDVDLNFSPRMPGHVTFLSAISATGVRGKNLRGAAAFASAASVTVTFNATEPDANYFIEISSNANETIWWSSPSTTGFTLNSSNATSTATVHWFIVR